MPLKKPVDTAAQKFLLLFLFMFFEADSRSYPSFPFYLIWFGQGHVQFHRMNHVGLSQSQQSHYPLAMIGLVRGHVIKFWPMRQKGRSTEDF